MGQKQTKEIGPSQETLDFNTLKGKPLKIEYKKIELQEGSFQKSIIKCPQGVSFSSHNHIGVVEGFTEGAVKNLITITKQKIRLYRVGLDSINFLSCSDLPEGDFSQLNKHMNISNGCTFFSEPSTQTVRILPRKAIKSFALQFDYKTGILLRAGWFYYHFGEQVKIPWKSFIRRHKNSNMISYHQGTKDRLEDYPGADIYILTRGAFKRRGIPMQWSRERKIKEERKFNSLLKDLDDDSRRNFGMGWLERLRFSKIDYHFDWCENEELALIVKISEGIILVEVYCFERRMKKKTITLSIFDIYSIEGVQDLLTKETQDRNEGDGEHQEEIFEKNQFLGCFFLPKRGCLFIRVRLNGINLRLRLDKVLGSPKLGALTKEPALSEDEPECVYKLIGRIKF